MPDDLRPPWRIQFDNARDPYTARNVLGIFGAGGGFITSVSSPLSVTGGNLTIDLSGYQPLDADLTAIAALTGTNTIYYRSAANTWSPVVISTGLSFSGGALTCTVSTAGLQPLDATLTALAAYNTNGLLTQTAPDTFTGRTLTGPAAGITVTNGNGVSGNPTLALADDLAALEALSGTNTIYYRSGTSAWTAVTIGTGLTFTGGTLAASGGGGNVSNSGTPVAGEIAEWVTATTIKGVSLSSQLDTRSLFRATRSSNQTAFGAGVFNQVAFSTAALNVGGHYNIGSFRWTPPAGRVLLTAALWTSNGTAGGAILAALYKNGTALHTAVQTISAAGNTGIELTTLDVANGTDYYELWLQFTAVGAGGGNMVAANSWFAGALL